MAFILVPVVFLLLKVLLIDPQLTPLRQTQLQTGAVQNVEHPAADRLRRSTAFAGLQLSAPGSAPSGETVRVDLYWRALQAHREELSDDGRPRRCERRSVEPQDARSAARLSGLSGDEYLAGGRLRRR